ncbi:ATP synthase F1 subunit epsilon [Ferroacidibacillus organovorans]|uniref:ATP synthase epsilon chain n=1 Tax=Ferroacidibacillus organovorans TaxID=1765683 RepID=A0A170MY92_9BACL|nr:ATP synthase F1 subunit epsilon [Ferroacidibacillus organovorans]KYP81464.1 hypothetical protein AYJ22_07530 [Ferroacidibacillus organovorans]OAG93992.1 hypothetical protein AYW79_07635 [Ferroacidibacillus organovorans]OPG16721.1 ATP synthase F1 subunit epsilon [Ferroacidibacillus organovorans]
MSTIPFEIVTPDRVVFSEQVEFLTVRTGAGEIGVLPRHAPLATTVKPGIVKIRTERGEDYVATTDGFLHVLPDQVSLLVNAAEIGSAVDVERAMRAKERAEERLSLRGDDVDVMRAELALERSLNRLRASELSPKNAMQR